MITLRPPGDKSISHRAVLFSSLADTDSSVGGLSSGEDVRSSVSVMRALGARLDLDTDPNGGLLLRVAGGARLSDPKSVLDCGNSGTTARLVSGILVGTGLEAVLDGDASLRSRPMRRVVYPLQAMGGNIEYLDASERLPLQFGRRASGALRTLRHRPRVASAQVKSALLLAGLTSRTRVGVLEPTLSRDHTERLLAGMGAPITFDPERRGEGEVHFDPAGWTGGLRGLDFRVPGDPSSAAFLIGAALLARRPIRVERVLANPGRIEFLNVMSEMGAIVQREPHGHEAGELVENWTVTPPRQLGPFEIAGHRIPLLIDEIPVLAVLASRARGRSRIRDAGELRTKESDRIAGLARNLETLGVRVEGRRDGLDVEGGFGRLEGVVRAGGDHRLAMAFGILEVGEDTAVTVDDPACASISYPGFWETLSAFRPAAGDPMRKGRTAATVAPEGAEPGRVIAIDGPAASGKSTTAHTVAEQLGYVHVNSGLFYRAITWWAIGRGLTESDPGFEAELRGLTIDLATGPEGLTVSVDGQRLGTELRGADVTAQVSAISTIPAVRATVLDRLREAGRRFSLVCDGRDIGTTVFPNADLKVYLVAEVPERARRRLQESNEPLTPEAIEAEAVRLDARDRADATRELSPLSKASDAIEIDTTGLSPTGVVDRIVRLARERGLGSPGLA